MKMIRIFLIILASGFLFCGCAWNQNLSERELFRPIIGQRLITQRVTYIYRHKAIGPYELWDSPHKYGEVSRSGAITWIKEEPIYVIPIGSNITIDKVIRENSIDNSPAIEARGTLQFEGKDIPITYLWGLKDQIQKAPWESPAFDAQDTRSIKSGD
jgi:hypothetical protein